MGGIQISPNIHKETVRINASGDIVDPKTKQVVKPNAPDYIPTREEIEAQINAVPVEQVSRPISTPETKLTIKEQIIQAEKHLADLKVLRTVEIEKMKAELAELEANE